MQLRFGLMFVAAAILVGCATPPQRTIALSATNLDSRTGRVGIAMTAIPKVDTHTPGASCLLCLAAASIANSKLTTYSHTLPEEGLPDLKKNLAELLRKRGVDAVVIDEDVNVAKLPNARSKGPDIAKKDFSALRGKYNVDHLIIIDIKEIGFERTYAAYVPTSDPKGVLSGLGYEVNLSDNAYEWYSPLNIRVSSDGKWDEPPKYPGLTNAYFQALEMGKDSLLTPFKS